MYDDKDQGWLDNRLKERTAERRQERLKHRNPTVPSIDAGKFASQLAKLTETLIHSVEREGAAKLPNSPVPLDTAIILRQLAHTYDLILYINTDDRRNDDPGYRQAYSFVILPLVRTMVDGFYNCTSLLDDPTRARAFRISGLYRIREAIQSDEARYGTDPTWREYLSVRRGFYEECLRAEGLTAADLDKQG